MATVVTHSPQSSSPVFAKRTAIAASPDNRPPGSSRLTGRHPVLPPIATPPQDDSKGEMKPNPFVMPPTNKLFSLRERERRQMKKERAEEHKLKVHEKSTYASRLNAKTASLRKQALTPDLQTTEGGMVDKESGIHEDTQFVLATTKDRRIEKEDLTSYVQRKKEMFLVQYALGVKRDEIKKLEDIAKAEERKLQAAEKYLEESATMFDEFLKENDKNAVEAIKMAEAATKAKLEKVAEIKRLNALLVATKNEISRNSDMLKELRTYKQFLDSLAPQEWQEQRESVKKMQSSSKSLSKLQLEDCLATSSAVSSKDEGDEYLDDEDVELYFNTPSQLVSIFTELEEQNLSLILNSQETEETLEEIRQNKKAVEEKMNRETMNLQKQIETLASAIAREEEKAYELEIKSKLYSFGEYKAEDQELMMAELDKKVADVYLKTIGTNDANLQTLQMLAAIESRLEELFETIESLPTEKVEAAEKSKEKERRMRLRENKLDEQRIAQEERLKRALERAQADPKKRTGRKLVYRSEPPVLKKKQKEKDEQKEREEEEMLYYFS